MVYVAADSASPRINTTWVLLHNPTFDVVKELCAWKMFVVASISHVLFWLCGEASEFGIPTSPLGGVRFRGCVLSLGLSVHCGSESWISTYPARDFLL